MSGEFQKKLLLHVCCAPCLSQSLRVLAGLDRWEKSLEQVPDFDITLYYENSNIYPPSEYRIRLESLKTLIKFARKNWKLSMQLVIPEYRPEEWIKKHQPMRSDKEGGRRCRSCFAFRLKSVFDYADREGFDLIATTLTISPYKNAELINSIGEKIAQSRSADYLSTNFKKNDGYLKSVRLSKQIGLYRQKYCGCLYSLTSSIPNAPDDFQKMIQKRQEN